MYLRINVSDAGGGGQCLVHSLRLVFLETEGGSPLASCGIFGGGPTGAEVSSVPSLFSHFSVSGFHTIYPGQHLY